MLVEDLITLLQAQPPKSLVMLDYTGPDSELFKFSSLVFADEVTTALGEKIVLLSHTDFNAESDASTSPRQN